MEAPWVRSVYLYLMCLVSVVLVGVGAIGAVTGAVHTIAPDLGHRDAIDRVGIGVANIATEAVTIFERSQGGGIEDFCREVTDSEADFDDCVSEEQGSGDDAGAMGSITDGIAQVKDELQNQIRNNSIDHLIRGLLLIAAGVLLFRIHGPRTELFALGLFPKAPGDAPGPAGVAVTTREPIPPPPPATPEL